MNSEKDTSAPPFWSPAAVLHITPSHFGVGGWDQGIVVPTQLLRHGLLCRPQSLCSRTSCSVSSPSLPRWLFVQLYCLKEYLLPQHNVALSHAAETGQDVPSSAPQCCDAPHPQKKFSPQTKLSCSRIAGIRHNPDTTTSFFPRHLWERYFIIQMIYLTIAVDLPPFVNSLGQDLSLIMFASCLPWAVPSTVMKIARQILTMWAIKHSLAGDNFLPLLIFLVWVDASSVGVKKLVLFYLCSINFCMYCMLLTLLRQLLL